MLTVAAATFGLASHADAKSAGITASVTGSTLNVVGTNNADNIDVRRGVDPNTIEVADGNSGTTLFSFDRSAIGRIDIAGLNGDDTIRIDQNNGLFTDTIQTTLEGGDGNDTLIGGDGNETFFGGNGNDTVDGNRGNDAVFLGAGNDTFQWDPGDASDTVEGQGGTDTMRFNGSNAAEHIDLSANGSRLRFTRDVAAITMDVNGVENVDVNTLGSPDTVTVNDLRGTGVQNVNVDLSSTSGSGSGDGAIDNVVVNGTAAADNVTVTGDSTHADVTGLASAVHVTGGEVANDAVDVNTLGGDDHVTASTDAGRSIGVFVTGGEGNDIVTTNGTTANDTFGIADNNGFADVFNATGGAINAQVEHENLNTLGGNDTVVGQNGLATITLFTIDGGAGNDFLAGTDGNDVIIGGTGNDTVDGNRGNDTVLMGSGNDTFQWDPGDGSDIVEGQGGTDTMVFNGSNAAENITLSANGSRLRLFRDVASVTMDVNGIENVDVKTLGSPDRITVNNLTGTSVKHVSVDLNGFGGTGDGAPDEVVLVGTNGNDRVNVTSANGVANVSGLVPTLSVSGGEPGLDRLELETLTGNDVVHSHLTADDIALFVNGQPA